MTRLEEQLDLLARARTLLPHSRAPYSAHVKLRYADWRESDMLLGGVFRRGSGIAILDWRTAPLAEVLPGGKARSTKSISATANWRAPSCSKTSSDSSRARSSTCPGPDGRLRR